MLVGAARQVRTAPIGFGLSARRAAEAAIRGQMAVAGSARFSEGQSPCKWRDTRWVPRQQSGFWVTHRIMERMMFIDKIKRGSWTAAAVIAIAISAAATATAQPSRYEETVMESHIVTGGSALKSQIVYFNDLNIETVPGATKLLSRVSTAASRLCGDKGRMDLRQWHSKRECSAQAIYRAVETVDDDTVWAAYDTRFPNRSKQFKSTTVLALLSDDGLVLQR